MSYLREPNDYDRQGNHAGHPDSLAGKDHELTLSTAAIFGIFFGLVLLCGIFFGFGYSLGNHKSGAVPVAENAASSGGPNFSAFKPAAGQPAGSHGDTSVSAASTPRPAPVVPSPSSESAATAEPIQVPQPAPVVRTSPPASTHPAAAATPAPPAPAPAVGLYVQVAAISVAHPGDATLLQNALKTKGYAVTAHSGPDSFIHLLIGPFSNRPAAEAMRQRLAGDGYIAYIK